MGLSIVRFFEKTADQTVTSSTALVSVTGLGSAIAANQRQKLVWWIPITVGAAGGVKLQIVVPAGGVLFSSTILLVNTVAPSLTPAAQSASAAFSDALANAGRHWLQVQADIVNGAAAGTVDLQMAQNSSNGTPLTITRGATLNVDVTG